jgi:hypothetical protein
MTIIWGQILDANNLETRIRKSFSGAAESQKQVVKLLRLKVVDCCCQVISQKKWIV